VKDGSVFNKTLIGRIHKLLVPIDLFLWNYLELVPFLGEYRGRYLMNAEVIDV
jgi:hypothetical protein